MADFEIKHIDAGVIEYYQVWANRRLENHNNNDNNNKDNNNYNKK